MAKTQGEQLRELAAAIAGMDTQLNLLMERVANLQTEAERQAKRDEELIAKSAAAEERATHLRGDVNTLREDLRRASERLSASEAKNAALEERARHQEKQSDRGFNFVQAVIISAISMIGGALLSQLFKK